MEPTKEASAIAERKRPDLILELWNNHLATGLTRDFSPDPIQVKAMELLAERKQVILFNSLKQDYRDPSPEIRKATERAIVNSLGWLYNELAEKFTPEQLTSPPPQPPQT